MLTLKSVNADSENIIYCGLRLAEVVNDEVKPVTSAAVKAVTDSYYSSMQRGDELLQAAINEEAAAREAAVLAENKARKADVQGLDDKIIFEQDEREGHDAALQTSIDNEAQTRQGDDDVLRGQIVAEVAAREAADAEVLRQSEINSVIFASAIDESPAMTIEQGDTTLEVPMPVAEEKKFGLMTPAQVSALSGAVDFVHMSNMPEWNELYPEQTKVRVVDINGENRQTNLLKLLAINKFADQWYGVRIDFNSADPALQRVGRDDLHRTLPIQSKMRRCVINDLGVVQYYLDAEDSTKKADGTAANLDGTDGQVMVEIPAFYYKCEQDADGATVMISEYPLPGFRFQRLLYVSAYQATVDRSDTSLASVCSMDERYRGCGNQVAWDGTYRTALGRPASNISLTNFRAYARKRGAHGLNGCGWNCYTYEANRAIYWLFVIEYATLNSQATFTAEADSNGFKQGGLGAGVSTLESGKWSAYNNYFPFVPCGITNALGNATGVVNYEMPTEYDASAASPKVVEVPSYRGVENPFGHVFQWMDGALINVQSDEAGGRSLLYVSFDPAKYSSTSVADYELVGDVPRNSGYIKRLLLGEGLCNIPYDTGGGSSTYHCDYFWTSIPATGTSLRGLPVGGNAYNGVNGGLTSTYTANAPTYALAFLGSRLCFVPS